MISSRVCKVNRDFIGDGNDGCDPVDLSWAFGGFGFDVAEFCRGDTSEGELKSCEQLVYFSLHGNCELLGLCWDA